MLYNGKIGYLLTDFPIFRTVTVAPLYRVRIHDNASMYKRNAASAKSCGCRISNSKFQN